MRVGILTGGGDCPGLNAVIRAIVRRGGAEDSFVGFRNGWAGVRDDDGLDLVLENTRGILPLGGTILGTSRTNPLGDGRAGLREIHATMARRGIDALAVIGGDGTLRGARDAHRGGVPLVGIPKTIDNDIGGTELSVGFQTAVQTATDAIDRLHTTAEAHHRVIVVEVMGRHAGWIAIHAGMAGGADAILVPERAFDVEEVCDHLHRRHQRGRTFSIVVVAEGVDLAAAGITSPASPHAAALGPETGVAPSLASEIERRTGFEARVTVLGHIQRGGTPNATDRILATQFGVGAFDALAAGRYGSMVALQGGKVIEVDLADALAVPNPVAASLCETAAIFFD